MGRAAASHDTTHIQCENELLRSIIAKASIALIALDGEERVDSWNSAAESIFGWSEEEVLGKAPPCLAQTDLHAHWKWWRDGHGSATVLIKTTRKDGTTLDVNMMPVIHRGPSGAPGRVLIAMTPVALYASEDDALRRSDERFRLVTLATQDAIYDWDMLSNAVWRSETFDTISGEPGARFADAEWWRSRIHPEDQGAAFQALEEAFASGVTSWTSEYRLLRSAGGYATLRDRGVIVRNDEGRPVRVTGAVTDVSEQRRLEVQVKESFERIRQAADELQGKNALLEVEISERARREESLRRQKQEILLLSAPVVQIWDKVLALPVIGAVDRDRSRQIMDRLLAEIVRTQSAFAILDLTGMGHVDTDTARHLLDIVRAARLLGSSTLLSGIAPVIAQTMVQMGVETMGVTTFGTLRDALEHALRATAGLGLPVRARGAGRHDAD